MTKAADIFNYLEELAPLSLAESYDNPGLLAGSGNQTVERALIALDITRDVCSQAASMGAQLVVSHHPVIFRPVRSVPSEGAGSAVWHLARNGLTAICMHTNLDRTNGGVNDALVQALGLQSPRILKAEGGFEYKKVTVFVPESSAGAVREAMAKAGAGKLGRYDSCAYETHGTGYFRPLAGAHPAVGCVGETARVPEVRVEAICKASLLDRVMDGVRRVHPYEEPAFDIFDEEAVSEPYGIGRLGELPKEMTLDDFARQTARRLGGNGAVTYGANRPVRRVAVCSGAWDGALTQASVDAGADVILTGEIKHSDMLDALACGLGVVAAGHFATEQVICPYLCDRLSMAFPEVVFRQASGGDPARYVGASGADGHQD